MLMPNTAIATARHFCRAEAAACKLSRFILEKSKEHTMIKPYHFVVLLFLLGVMALPPAVTSAETMIPLNNLPNKIKKMPPVFFAHDRHVKRLEKENLDCISCHVYTDEGFCEKFLTSDQITEEKRAIFMHKNCVHCHTQINKNTGPDIIACRSCHKQLAATTAVPQK